MSCVAENFNFSGECWIYGSRTDLACHHYLGGKLVYFGEKNRDNFFVENAQLMSIINYLSLLASSKCTYIFLKILCHYLYPSCAVHESNGKQRLSLQKVCAESCNYLHRDICQTNLVAFGKQLDAIKTVNVKGKFRNALEMLSNNNCGNRTLFPSKEEQLESVCFLETNTFQRYSELCHGNGYIYNGTVRKTKSGKPCKNWSHHCPQLLNSESDWTHAYCRNPNGYREGAWCYINNSISSWGKCDIRKCTGIDGNYTEWSSFIGCSKSFGTNSTMFRYRNCTSPAPYFGQNCSHYGPDIEVVFCAATLRETASIHVKVVIGLCTPVFLLFVAIVIVKYAWNRKPNTTTPDLEYCETELSPKNIVSILSYKNEETQFLDEIYEAISMFRDCLCSRCINSWLVEIISQSPQRDSVIIQEQVSKMMIELKSYQDVDLMRPGKTHLDCLSEHVVREWVSKHVLYDKLTVGSDRKSGARLFFGAFDISEPIYDKLKFSNKSN